MIMVGLIQEIMAVKLVNYSEFVLIHTFLTLSDYEIIQIQIHRDYMFWLNNAENAVQAIEFKNQMDQSENYSMGRLYVTFRKWTANKI